MYDKTRLWTIITKKNNMKVEKKEVVCIRLPESIKKKVDAQAKKMYLAPSKLVSIIVEMYYIEKP